MTQPFTFEDLLGLSLSLDLDNRRQSAWAINPNLVPLIQKRIDELNAMTNEEYVEHEAKIDRWYNQNITVTLLDTETGEVRQSSDYGTYFWWEGNGSCDCNRKYPFLTDDDEVEHGRCDGHERYLIVDVAGIPDEALELKDFNDGYPDKAFFRAKLCGYDVPRGN